MRMAGVAHAGGYLRAANAWLTTLCDLRPS